MGLLFGISGFPHSIPKGGNVFDAIKTIKDLELDGMELAFVRSIWLKEEKAHRVAEEARKAGLFLSAHAQYFINLNAKEKNKVEASYQRLLKASRISMLAGAENVVYHAGYYLGEEKKKVLEIMRNRIKNTQKILSENNININLRPETTGKGSQFGSFEELLDISKSNDILPCIDFAHLHARSIGKVNTEIEFIEVLDRLEGSLGKKIIDNMHIHVSGIEYGQKGEIRHLPLEESDFNYKDLLRALKKKCCSGRVICESPFLEKDALLLKDYYEKL